MSINLRYEKLRFWISILGAWLPMLWVFGGEIPFLFTPPTENVMAVYILGLLLAVPLLMASSVIFMLLPLLKCRECESRYFSVIFFSLWPIDRRCVSCGFSDK